MLMILMLTLIFKPFLAIISNLYSTFTYIQIFVYLDVFITLCHNLWNFICTNFHKLSAIMTSQSQLNLVQRCHGNV